MFFFVEANQSRLLIVCTITPPAVFVFETSEEKKKSVRYVVELFIEIRYFAMTPSTESEFFRYSRVPCLRASGIIENGTNPTSIRAPKPLPILIPSYMYKKTGFQL